MIELSLSFPKIIMSSEIISLAPSGLEHLNGSENVGVSADDMMRVSEQTARAVFARQMT